MKKTTEWLFATDITRRRRFVIHAAAPYFFAEMADAIEERTEAILDSFSYSGGGYDIYNFIWLPDRPDDAAVLKLLARATEAIRTHNDYAATIIRLAGAESIGERVRAIRQELGISQAELARRIEKLSPGNLCEIERDEKDIRLSTFRKIATALGVPPSELIGD